MNSLDKSRHKNEHQAEFLVSIVIATKNRQDCLQVLINSIRQQDYKHIEIIIGDDGSDLPVSLIGTDIKILRNEISKGACFMRNRCLEMVQGDFILICDDDTEFIDSTTISRALILAETYPHAGGIAFYQLSPDGTPRIQPAKSDSLCYVVTPIFYAFLLRRQALLKVGSGFIEVFNYYHEEVEFSLRLLDAGYKVIYDPNLKIKHYADERGRNLRRINRFVARNSILTTLLRYPYSKFFPEVLVPLYLFILYVKDQNGQRDLVGVFWILKELISLIPFILSNRKIVKSETVNLFKQIRLNHTTDTNIEVIA